MGQSASAAQTSKQSTNGAVYSSFIQKKNASVTQTSTQGQQDREGFPALRASTIPSSTEREASIQQTPISPDEVKTFVESHQLPVADNLVPPKVVSAEILTAQEITAKLRGEPVSANPNQRFWFVELSGKFAYAHDEKHRTNTRAYEVFDLTTGNLVQFGAF